MWTTTASITFVVAVLVGLFTVLFVFAAPFVTVNATELPVGHPHHEIYKGETSFSCTHLVGYALGDRDPLCQRGEREGAAIVVSGFLIALASASVSVWCWRRRQVRGAGDQPASERHALRRVRRTVIVGSGAVVILLAAGAVFLPTNTGSWESTKSIPPGVAGLREWQDRVRPLVADLAHEADRVTAAIDLQDLLALRQTCDQLADTATQLASTATPAPDGQLDTEVRKAVLATTDAAQTCQQAAQREDVGVALDSPLALVSATVHWQAATDRVLELKIGPAN